MNPTLLKFPLLEDVPESERLELLEYLVECTHEAGRVLFREGSEAERLYLVESGRVRLARGAEQLGVASGGDALGALALVCIGARECDAVALESTRVLELSRESFLRLRDDAPELALRLLEGIMRTLSDAVRMSL